MSRITELLDLKGIEYKDTGGDILICCLNPDHDDKHPSLRIDHESGIMHCLSCGFGRGIPSIYHYFNETQYRQSPRLSQVRKKISEIRNGSTNLAIPESAYLFEGDFRGISSKTLKKYFAFQHQADWEGRIVFPITDAVGRNILFLGRSINSSAPPKYLVKPKQVSPPIFPVRYNTPVLVLVEGIFDMLNLEDNGVDYASCCFGTHQFTSDNIADKFSPYIIAGVRVVVILLDNDASGNKAAQALAKLIRTKTRLTPVVGNFLLPEGKDPDDLNKEEIDMLAQRIEILVAESLKDLV
ncbi:DNA primase/helicase [Salmonella phage vB_SenS_UTK0010]|uniref:DNA primase/helicase n=1 Tax=Salmonella phage vB_SenS_UTK0010 TaxID=3028909 RepID=A0AAF0CJP0_9CAUD|nr:DNA primase/helicase [Salmonella phage vB_SenS_UTK0010]